MTETEGFSSSSNMSLALAQSQALSEYLEGPLKQQCLGDSGLYHWDDKYFRLHVPSGVLEVFPKNEDTKEYETEATVMSFSGAKHAKEWSISTPTIGSYGYDVVWDSGRIWSFLAKDMSTCRQWVQAINSAINHNPVDTHKRPDMNTQNIDTLRKTGYSTGVASVVTVPVKGNFVSDQSRDSDVTKLETHTPGGHGTNNANQATQERFRAEESGSSRLPSQIHDNEHQRILKEGHVVKFHERDNDQNSDCFNISAIPLVPSSDGTPESSPDTDNELNTKPRPNSHGVQPFSMNDAGFDSENTEIKQRNEKIATPLRSRVCPDGIEDTPVSRKDAIHTASNNEEADKQEIKLLKREQRRLEAENEELQYDVKSARLQLNEVKEDSSRRCRDLEWQLAQAQELQVKAATKYNHDLEQALLRAQVENQNVYEASQRALKEQNRREVACLQDELVDERKRYGNLLLQEKKMRGQADTNESELRIKYSNLLEKYSSLEKQFEHDNADFRNSKLKWEREKNEIERAQEARIQKIIEEKDNLIFEAKEDARRKVDSMTINFNKSIKDMESSVQDSCRQAFQNEKMMALTALEKRNSNAIEKVRQEERNRADVERNKLRDSFVRREKETMEDLQCLEQLHQEQLDRLQSEVKMYQKIISDNEMSWEDTKTESARVEEMKRRQTEAHLHTVRQHVQRAEHLEYELQQAHAEVQQARAEESKYREQLARAIEESKIQRAEYIKIQKQCENDAAMANSWRTASKESELSLASYDTSLKIAREELMMVERNYARVQDENRRLKEALQYADNVVYGPAQQGLISSLQLENRIGGSNSFNKKGNNGSIGKKAGGSRSTWVPTYL